MSLVVVWKVEFVLPVQQSVPEDAAQSAELNYGICRIGE